MKLFLFFLCLYPVFLFAELSILLSPDTWDLGTISDTKVHRQTLKIKNLLSYPVKLTHAITSCSCNAIMELPPLLNPGEEKEFFVTLNPAGKMGRYLWEMNLYTDSKDIPMLTLPIRAYVLKDTLVSENPLHIKPFFKGDAWEKKFWIASRHKPDFQIFSAECNIPGFIIETTKSPVEGFYGVEQGYTLRLSCEPGIAPGSKKGEILVKTDLVGQEMVSIPVFAYVNGYIQTIPAYLAFGMMNPGKSYRKVFRVSHNQIQQAFQIKEIKCSIPEVQTKLKVLIENHFYEIEVTWAISQDMIHGEQRGYLELITDVAKEPVIKLPLLGIVFGKQ